MKTLMHRSPSKKEILGYYVEKDTDRILIFHKWDSKIFPSTSYQLFETVVFK